MRSTASATEELRRVFAEPCHARELAPAPPEWPSVSRRSSMTHQCQSAPAPPREVVPAPRVLLPSRRGRGAGRRRVPQVISVLPGGSAWENRNDHGPVVISRVGRPPCGPARDTAATMSGYPGRTDLPNLGVGHYSTPCSKALTRQGIR